MDAKDLTAVLPDGSLFDFWEVPLIFERTLHVNARTGDDLAGDGSAERPYATINRAAREARAGTRVLIAPGEYRECVRPLYGGTDATHMVSYEADGGDVVIKASEAVTEFAESRDYKIGPGPDGETPVIWQHAFAEDFFRGYNPFGVISCIHEKEWLRYSWVEQDSSLVPYLMRRGMVFVDGEPLRQVPLYRLMAEEPGTYWVEEDGMKVHFRMPDDSSPEGHLIEMSCREQCFAPKAPFLSYIRVKGLTMLHAANGSPVPQRGALSCGRGHHWIVEGCVIRDASALGMDIGNEGWSLKQEPGQLVGYAVVRGCVIDRCGVCGIAGLGVKNSLIEDNLISRTGWQHMEYGWEAGALKFHDCENTLFRRNIFRDSDQCDVLWLDCNNYNDRVTGNLFLNNRAPHGVVFMECDRGLRVPREVLIDDNVIWGSYAYAPKAEGKRTITIDSTHWNDPFDPEEPLAAGDAVTGYGSDDMHLAHNLIGDCDGAGYLQTVVRGRMHTGRGGTSRGSVMNNNVFYDCRGGALRLPNHDIAADGNVYAKMPQGFLTLVYPAPSMQLDLAAWQRFEGHDRCGRYAACTITVDEEALTMTIARGERAFPWDEETEGYDALPAVPADPAAAADYFGRKTGPRRMPGPFEVKQEECVIGLDPRAERFRGRR